MDYSKMTLVQLRDVAREKGLKKVSSLKKDALIKVLEEQQKENNEKELVEHLENELIKNNQFTLPPTLVAEETADLIQVYKKRSRKNMEEKELIEKLQPVAIRNLSLTYILHAISQKENITATDEDLQEELNKALATLKTEEEKKKAKKLFEERKEYIRSSLIENKTVAFVKENAEIKEVK